MPSSRAPVPSLADLRTEIDRIDETMHVLLMERGEIIDRLIAVKRTEETGSAFRPAREAEMMRRLVQRHHGILPLDTVESIWRVIIATFTYVQAPFSVHADLSPVKRSCATARFLRLHRRSSHLALGVIARSPRRAIGCAGDHHPPGAWWRPEPALRPKSSPAPSSARNTGSCSASAPHRTQWSEARCGRQVGRIGAALAAAESRRKGLRRRGAALPLPVAVDRSRGPLKPASCRRHPRQSRDPL
jgi:chorismate mutase